MGINYELADLFAKTPKRFADSLLAKGLPIDEDALRRAVCRDANAFLHTYEQVCSIEPGLSAETLADSLLTRLISPTIRLQTQNMQTFEYFVCGHCGAKFFSSFKTAPCPRCGHTNRSSERLVPPWRSHVSRRTQDL